MELMHCNFGFALKYRCLFVAWLSVCQFPYISITSLMWTVCPCLNLKGNTGNADTSWPDSGRLSM